MVRCTMFYLIHAKLVYPSSLTSEYSLTVQDGKVELVQAASVSIHKAHGQYIENIHLEPYSSEEQFWEVLYNHKYSRLVKKAAEFLADTGGPGDDVLVFIRSAPSPFLSREFNSVRQLRDGCLRT